MMVMAGYDPYDQNIHLEITIGFDFGQFLKGLNLGDLKGMFSDATDKAKGMIKVRPSSNEPGTKAKGKVIDGAAPIDESEAEIRISTGKQEIKNSTLDPQDTE